MGLVVAILTLVIWIICSLYTLGLIKVEEKQKENTNNEETYGTFDQPL